MPLPPSVTVLPVIAVSDATIAAPNEVPPATCRALMDVIAAVWSGLGRVVVMAPWLNPTTPTSTVSGWAWMNAMAAAWAAANRDGVTSVAVMLVETSMVTMTVPASRPTGSDAVGPAAASASTTSPASVHAIPIERRRPPGTAIPAAARADERRRPSSTTPVTSAAITSRPSTNSHGDDRLISTPLSQRERLW